MRGRALPRFSTSLPFASLPSTVKRAFSNASTRRAQVSSALTVAALKPSVLSRGTPNHLPIRRRLGVDISVVPVSCRAGARSSCPSKLPWMRLPLNVASRDARSVPFLSSGWPSVATKARRCPLMVKLPWASTWPLRRLTSASTSFKVTTRPRRPS